MPPLDANSITFDDLPSEQTTEPSARNWRARPMTPTGAGAPGEITGGDPSLRGGVNFDDIGFDDLPSSLGTPHLRQPAVGLRPFAPGEWLDNPDGSWSNEITTTVQDPALNNGKPTVVPSLWLRDGEPIKAKNEDEAAAWAAQSGLRFPSFLSMDDAEDFTRAREANWQKVPREQAASVPPLWSPPEQAQPSFMDTLRQRHEAITQGWREGYEGTPPVLTPEAEAALEQRRQQGGMVGTLAGAGETAADFLTGALKRGGGALGAIQGAVAQSIAEATGDEQLGRDIASMPEAFMGMPGALRTPEAAPAAGPQPRVEPTFGARPAAVSAAALPAPPRLLPGPGEPPEAAAPPPTAPIPPEEPPGAAPAAAEAPPTAEPTPPAPAERPQAPPGEAPGEVLTGEVIPPERSPAAPTAPSDITFTDLEPEEEPPPAGLRPIEAPGVGLIGYERVEPPPPSPPAPEPEAGEVAPPAVPAEEAAPPPPPSPETAAHGPWREVGKNHIGDSVYENPNGVRAVFDNGVPWMESVREDADKGLVPRNPGDRKQQYLIEGEAFKTERPKPAEEPEWRLIGENSEGDPVYTNPQGVHSIVRNGVRQVESVRLRETDDGMQMFVPGPDDKSPQFRVVPRAEKAAEEPAWQRQNKDIPTEIFRGTGREKQEAAYGPMAPPVPIMGPGRYSAFSEDEAAKFGPTIERSAVDLENPLVIRSDDEWRSLTREAGWKFPNPSGQPKDEVERQTSALRDLVKSRGHDGIVVYWDDKTKYDFDSSGRSIKTLRNVLGTPQVVDYRQREPERKPKPEMPPEVPREPEPPAAAKPEPPAPPSLDDLAKTIGDTFADKGAAAAGELFPKLVADNGLTGDQARELAKLAQAEMRGLGWTGDRKQGAPPPAPPAAARPAPPAQPAPPAPSPETAAHGPWREVGKNHLQDTVYENPNGVRAIFEAGVPWMERVREEAGRGLVPRNPRDRRQQFLIEGEPFKTEREPAAPAEEPEWKLIGSNAEGLPVYTNPQGVHSVVENGERRVEQVRLAPTDQGMQISIPSHAEKTREFQAVTPAAEPTIEAASGIPRETQPIVEPPPIPNLATTIADTFAREGAPAAGERFKQLVADHKLTRDQAVELSQAARQAMTDRGWKGGQDEPAPPQSIEPPAVEPAPAPEERVTVILTPPSPSASSLAAPATTATPSTARATSSEVITHTTQRGKVLTGVIRRDLTYTQAKALDPYTFKKDGGYFIRAAAAARPTETAPIPTEAPSPETIATDIAAETQSRAKQVTWLRDQATKLEQAAQKDENRSRLANTPKRARQVASATEDARARQQIATTMQNLADGIERGELTKLAGINTRVAVEQLDAALRQAVYARQRAENLPYHERERQSDAPITSADISYAKFPGVYLHTNWSREVANAIEKAAPRGNAPLIRWLRNQGSEGVVYPTLELIEQFRAAFAAVRKKAGKLPHELQRVSDSIAKGDRLRRIGINNDRDLQDALREYIQYRGARKQENQTAKLERELVGAKPGIDFFPTPKVLADRMVQEADIKAGMRVLEPSAGKGDLADAARDAGAQVDTIEVSPTLQDLLQAKGHKIVSRDFDEFQPTEGYDRIIMNPPFSGGKDAVHVQRAYDMLKPGGRLVAITGEGIHFRNDKQAVAFRKWLDEHDAEVEKLPEGSFKSAFRPTGVATRIVVIDKPAEESADGH